MSAWLKGDKCTLIMQHDDWMPSNKRAVMTQRATFLVGSCNVATQQMNTSCTTDRRLYVYSNDLYGWQSSVIPHYASAVLLSVCLSHVGVLSKRLRGASWFCWHKNFLQPILHYVMGKFGYLQKVRILPLCNFVSDSELEKFLHGKSIVATCCQLSSTTCDGRRLVYHTDRQPVMRQLTLVFMLRDVRKLAPR